MSAVAPDRRAADLVRAERLEADYWRTTSAGTSDLHSIASLTNTINKLTDAGVFLTSLLPFRPVFEQARSILELGAGQGWASCLVKRLVPAATITATDLSPAALRACPAWEHLFQVKLDRAICSRSYALPLRDGSVDVALCFAAAHHFRAQRRTLAELARVLAPGGHAFYFFEPSCPRIWHRVAVWRVNRKRPDVPEDVLVPRTIVRLAREVGLTCRIDFDPQLYKRAPVETIYYGLLNAIPPLQRLLPCTVTFHFEKPAPVAGRSQSAGSSFSTAPSISSVSR